MAEKIVNIADSVTVGELAETLDLSVTTLIGELFKNGIAATINQRLDFETAQIIVEELGLDVELAHKKTTMKTVRRTHQLSDKAVPRPPIVAVMGRVLRLQAHGKYPDRVLCECQAFPAGGRCLGGHGQCLHALQ